jgi:hypothetical protein
VLHCVARIEAVKKGGRKMPPSQRPCHKPQNKSPVLSLHGV